MADTKRLPGTPARGIRVAPRSSRAGPGPLRTMEPCEIWADCPRTNAPPCSAFQALRWGGRRSHVPEVTPLLHLGPATRLDRSAHPTVPANVGGGSRAQEGGAQSGLGRRGRAAKCGRRTAESRSAAAGVRSGTDPGPGGSRHVEWSVRPCPAGFRRSPSGVHHNTTVAQHRDEQHPRRSPRRAGATFATPDRGWRREHYFKSDGDLRSYLQEGKPQPKTVVRQRPDLSPAHIPAPSGAGDTRYRLNSGRTPASYQFPQSPTHAGDDRIPVTSPLDFTAAHGALTNFQGQASNQLSSKRKTLNTFSYDLEALVRLTRIDQVEPDAWGYDPDSTHQTASAQSEVYQSDGKIVPASRNALGSSRLADKAAANASIRHAIKLSYETASQFDQFADTSVMAFNRAGTVDYQKVEQQRGAGRNKAYIIADQSLGCAMFHSETQALGLAARELPATMKALVDGIIRACMVIGAPVQAVIVGLKVVGVSHPNAVCRGACKPALVTLLDLINQHLVADYHPRKPALQAQQIYLRRSEEYRATMDVQGLQLFLGSETGGVREAAPVVPGHGQVTEHAPRQ